MAASSGTGPTRGGRSGMPPWRQPGMREWMFRVRNWTGEEINSGRGAQTNPEKRENAPLGRGDTTPFAFTRSFLKAADGRREATGDERKKSKEKKKQVSGGKSCKVRQRRRVELMVSGTWQTVARYYQKFVFIVFTTAVWRLWVCCLAPVLSAGNRAPGRPAVSNLLHPPLLPPPPPPGCLFIAGIGDLFPPPPPWCLTAYPFGGVTATLKWSITATAPSSMCPMRFFAMDGVWRSCSWMPTKSDSYPRWVEKRNKTKQNKKTPAPGSHWGQHVSPAFPTKAANWADSWGSCGTRGDKNLRKISREDTLLLEKKKSL